MTALIQALSRPFAATTTNAETATLRVLAIFCCAGLVVSMMLASYGLDLSPGFF
jgi:hypothetical protein